MSIILWKHRIASPKDAQTGPKQDRQYPQRLDVMQPQRLSIPFPLPAQDPMPLPIPTYGIRIGAPIEMSGDKGSFLFFLGGLVCRGVVTDRGRL